MQLQIGQRVRVMWLRDIIASDTVEVGGSTTDTTVSGTLIPAGTIYDGTVARVAPDGVFELVIAQGHVISLHNDDPAIAIAVLTEFAPRQE